MTELTEEQQKLGPFIIVQAYEFFSNNSDEIKNILDKFLKNPQENIQNNELKEKITVLDFIEEKAIRLIAEPLMRLEFGKYQIKEVLEFVKHELFAQKPEVFEDSRSIENFITEPEKYDLSEETLKALNFVKSKNSDQQIINHAKTEFGIENIEETHILGSRHLSSLSDFNLTSFGFLENIEEFLSEIMGKIDEFIFELVAKPDFDFGDALPSISQTDKEEKEASFKNSSEDKKEEKEDKPVLKVIYRGSGKIFHFFEQIMTPDHEEKELVISNSPKETYRDLIITNEDDLARVKINSATFKLDKKKIEVKEEVIILPNEDNLAEAKLAGEATFGEAE
jgi:hypothetical protein